MPWFGRAPTFRLKAGQHTQAPRPSEIPPQAAARFPISNLKSQIPAAGGAYLNFTRSTAVSLPRLTSRMNSARVASFSIASIFATAAA